MRIKLILVSILLASGELALAAPSATPPAARTAAPPTRQESVLHAVHGWKTAWMARDAAAFLACYSATFKPASGVSRTVWEQRRRDSFEHNQQIKISLSRLSVQPKDDAHAEVRFIQHFDSDRYRETSRKTLGMVKVGEQWKIQTEDSATLTASTLPEQAQAAPEAPAADSQSPEQAVRDTVQAWAATWSAREADKFLTFYDAAFAPEDGLGRAAWEQRRRQHFKRVASLRVNLSDMSMTFPDETHATVRFTQDFRTPGYHEVSEKTLTLSKSEPDWKIVAEHNEQRQSAEPPPVATASTAETTQPTAPVAAPQSAAPVAASGETAEPPAEVKPAAVAAPTAGPVSAPASAVPPAAPGVAPEPAARPPLATPPRSALDTVHQWAHAWSERNVEKYLAFYGEQFQPAGKTALAAWKAQRRERIARTKSISVTLHITSISMSDMNHATIDFIQDYQSDLYQDLTRKRLKLEKHGDRWQIVGEYSGLK